MAVLLVVGLYIVIYRSRLGMALRMVAAGHDIAHLMGVNVLKTLRSAFVIAGAFGASAGYLLGFVSNMANPLLRHARDREGPVHHDSGRRGAASRVRLSAA